MNIETALGPLNVIKRITNHCVAIGEYNKCIFLVVEIVLKPGMALNLMTYTSLQLKVTPTLWVISISVSRDEYKLHQTHFNPFKTLQPLYDR